jgi:hypothetical protein
VGWVATTNAKSVSSTFPTRLQTDLDRYDRFATLFAHFLRYRKVARYNCYAALSTNSRCYCRVASLQPLRDTVYAFPTTFQAGSLEPLRSTLL